MSADDSQAWFVFARPHREAHRKGSGECGFERKAFTRGGFYCAHCNDGDVFRDFMEAGSNTSEVSELDIDEEVI